MGIYKVSCEYYIEAEDRDEAIDFVSDEFASGDFYERHIMINPSELPEGEEPFNK